jgi:hypothetical protein
MSDEIPKQVICMKWGSLYGAHYVNCLYAMTRRNLKGSLRFVCLTDNSEGIREEVECHPCPELDIPMPHRNRGWRKLSTYASSQELFGLQDQWLFLDLDVVITGQLDDFFTYEPEKSFVVMKNWSQPGKGIGNTSVYRFKVGQESYLLDNLLQHQDEVFSQYTNSQTYISRNVKELTFWPDEWCALFKVQCVPSWPQRFWQEPKLPDRVRVVAFPGVPNPDHALAGIWPNKCSLQKCYKWIRPTRWISDYWRED